MKRVRFTRMPSADEAARLDASSLDCLVCGRVFTLRPRRGLRHGSLSPHRGRASDHDRPPLRFIILLSNFSSPNVHHDDDDDDDSDDSDASQIFSRRIDCSIIILCSPLGNRERRKGDRFEKKAKYFCFLNNEAVFM